METEFINHNDEARLLTKFEEENLKDWFYNEGDFEEINAEAFKEWKEETSWVEIDLIMAHYVK